MLGTPTMLCEVKSWIPDAIASTLSQNSNDRASQPVIAWLSNIRASIEEYEPLIAVKPCTLQSDDEEPVTPDSAFDEILSQLGKELYNLDLYKSNFSHAKEEEVSLSILNLFDECIEGMTETLVNGDEKQSCVKEIDSESAINGDVDENHIVTDGPLDANSEKLQHPSKSVDLICDKVNEGQVNGEVNGNVQDSDCESNLSNVSFVTSTPVASERRNVCNLPEMLNKTNERTPPPVPPRRKLLKTPSSASASPYDNKEIRTVYTINEVAKRLASDSDSESTCWSYKECSTDGEIDPKELYAAVWSHSSGFHNSDEILRKVLSQHQGTVTQISFDTPNDFSPPQYVYALPAVGTGVVVVDKSESVVAMTSDKPAVAAVTADDGYEAVRDAITTDENIYEEIEYGYSYTDEGCSCEGSVGVESCSISASSECVDRESPVYVNLKDNDAYAITADVIFWKNLLLDPYYNDDEEDEWITPEECAVYSREQRPPLVIPRITQYRPTQRNNVQLSYAEDIPQEPVKSSVRQYDRLHDWSPGSERGFKAGPDSPTFTRLHKRFGGSTENILITNNARRPTHLQLPNSSSGDSLDVEVREKPPGQAKNRKSRSMLVPKQRVRSPVPAPRMLIHQPPVTVLLEGPVKRTKFSENGKKSRKNWVDCYMTLTPTSLVFYKDQKTYLATKQPRPPGSPPSPTAPRAELVLPLQHAHIMHCIQMHTRRYTRSLVLTVGYDQYLLQDETEEGAKRWLMSIQNVYYKLGPPKLDDFPNQVQYQSSNTDLESLGRTPPVSRHSNRSNQKAGGSSNEDLSDSTEVSIPKSHVKRRLRNFFAKRPTMDSLVKKGIYQEEPVFGRKLEEVCPNTSPRVPEFVVACVKEIESSEENMTTDGLYRASGNLSQVQKIRLEVDQNNLSVLENSSDIHVLTGSLKLFFRELKEPLIPCYLFDRVLAACSIKPREARIKEFRDVIHSLPQCNRDTLKYLLEHLLRVTQYSERNRMHTANLAIVFGPTLLWAPAEQAHNIAIDCIQQNHVVEILLNDFKEIFAEENGKGKKKT